MSYIYDTILSQIKIVLPLLSSELVGKIMCRKGHLSNHSLTTLNHEYEGMLSHFSPTGKLTKIKMVLPKNVLLFDGSSAVYHSSDLSSGSFKSILDGQNFDFVNLISNLVALV